ncbi:MAG: hypothetical protein Q9169_007430 [Polycauliona sp. 2 TL-2023]
MSKVATTISLNNNKDIFPEVVDSECYRGWLGIREIFERSYWERIWVYQEATYRDNTPFFCGHEHFTMGDIIPTAFLARHFSYYRQFANCLRAISGGAAYRMAAFRTKGVIRDGDNLLDLIEYLRVAECSEPRDKVYAVLGMAADQKNPGRLIPDYSKPLAEVYTDAVRFSLSQEDHGLRVLGHVMQPASGSDGAWDVPDLPSWVPNYQTAVFNTFQSLAYNACGANRAHDASLDGSRLLTRGLRVDEVVSVSEVRQNPNSTAEVEAWSPEDPDNVYGPTGQSRDEAFRTTVVADMSLYPKARGHILVWRLIHADVHTLSAEEAFDQDNMSTALRCTSGGRRFCWTKQGRMGLVPPFAQAGDLLFVLWGGQMIHVLRPKDNGTFFYVGDSYIHGIMDGDLVTDETEDGQTVVLE